MEVTNRGQYSCLQIPDAVQDKDSPAYNKGNIGIFLSRSAVAKAYQEQASLDLKKFLDVRAAELAPEGLLFFTSPGRLSSEQTKPNHDSWVEFTVDLNETWNAQVAEVCAWKVISRQLLHFCGFSLKAYMELTKCSKAS